MAREIATARAASASALTEGNYAEALKALANLQQPVDDFFENVMVNADDEAVRQNRLALLNQLRELFLQIADISILN